MILDFVLLADAASHSREKKLTIAGEFNTLFAAQVPMVYPLMVLVARYRATREEATRPLIVEVRLVGPAGQELALHRVPEAMTFVAEDPTLPIRADAILRLVGTLYPEHGDYQWQVLHDGAPIGHVALRVRPPALSVGA
jgi:hypothetical protein